MGKGTLRLTYPRRTSLLVLVLVSVAGCDRHSSATLSHAETTLTVGFGSTTGTRIQQVSDLITQEGLVNLGPDGRSMPWLAESWKASPNGLSWVFSLRRNVAFHDGTHLTSTIVRDALRQQLPGSLGSAMDDIAGIETTSPTDVVISLRKPSRFLLEALNLLLHSPTSLAGT